MESGNFFYIAAADLCGVAFGKLFYMMGDIEFFSSTKNQVNAWYFCNLLWLQLGIAACDHHKAFRCLSLNAADQLTAFLICIIGNRAGIDDIHVCQVIKLFFLKSFLFQ